MWDSGGEGVSEPLSHPSPPPCLSSLLDTCLGKPSSLLFLVLLASGLRLSLRGVPGPSGGLLLSVVHRPPALEEILWALKVPGPTSDPRTLNPESAF